MIKVPYRIHQFVTILPDTIDTESICRRMETSLVLHAETLPKLKPEDFKLINEEHERLNDSLNRLCTTCHNMDTQLDCQSCGREKLATCQGRLVSFFHNVINFTSTHFKHEESIMLRQSGVSRDDEDYCRHHQAHIHILNKLNEIINECDVLDARGNTAEAYRNLCNRMSEQFAAHDRTFDGIYLKERHAEASIQ